MSAQKQAEKLLAEWKKILRFQDWDIRVQVVPVSEIGGRYFGDVNWNLTKPNATIRIVDPQQVAADAFPEDIELVLVHELVHLHNAHWSRTLPEGTPENDLLEQGINKIARALVALKRQAA